MRLTFRRSTTSGRDLYAICHGDTVCLRNSFHTPIYNLLYQMRTLVLSPSAVRVFCTGVSAIEGVQPEGRKARRRSPAWAETLRYALWGCAPLTATLFEKRAQRVPTLRLAAGDHDQFPLFVGQLIPKLCHNFLDLRARAQAPHFGNGSPRLKSVAASTIRKPSSFLIARNTACRHATWFRPLKAPSGLLRAYSASSRTLHHFRSPRGTSASD